MKTKAILFICILGLLLSNLNVTGQTLLDFKMRLEREEVSKYKFSKSKNKVALKNNFGKYEILNPDDIKAIKGQTVFSVEVVSDFTVFDLSSKLLLVVLLESSLPF